MTTFYNTRSDKLDKKSKYCLIYPHKNKCWARCFCFFATGRGRNIQDVGNKLETKTHGGDSTHAVLSSERRLSKSWYEFNTENKVHNSRALHSLIF